MTHPFRTALLTILLLFLLCFASAASADVALDEAHFPDDAFRQLLSQKKSGTWRS